MDFLSMILDTVFTRYIDYLFPFILVLTALLFVDRLIISVIQAIDLKRWR